MGIRSYGTGEILQKIVMNGELFWEPKSIMACIYYDSE